MKPVNIQNFGLGRVTAVAPALAPFGSAADSLNLLHTTTKTAELRPGMDRVWATRTGADAVLWAFEYVKSDLSIVYVTKLVDTMYSFDALTPATALGSLETGMTSGFRSSVVNANGKLFIADSGKNYSSDGTSAGTHELQLAAQSSGWITLASAGTATGNPAGTVYYSFTRVQAYDGAEHAPSAALAVTRTVDQGVTVTNAALSFTDPWTTVRLWRTKSGGSQFYLVAGSLTSGSFPYADVSLDSSLTTASTVHGDDVLTALIEKPEAAKHACFHRGRLFLANLTSLPSRLRWSLPLEPTQFSSATTARRDIGKLDGGEITGIVSFRSSLVIFKRFSIHILNGDDDDLSFVIAEAVPGYGCVAPRTIVVDGDEAIYFLSARGVCSYDLSSVRLLSQPIEEEIRDLLVTTYGSQFVAGIEPRNHLYCLSVTPSGATTNTKTHVYHIGSGAWGRFEYGMGKILPTCYTSVGRDGPIRNSAGNVKLYVGAANGYLYETDTTTASDGVSSGDKTATVTSATATTTTAGAAAFRTTGDGLKGLPMTVRRAADNSYETVEITSNTATVITHPALSGTAIVADDTIFVGALEGTLSLQPTDLGTDMRKRWGRVIVRMKKQTHTVPLRVGYVLNDGSAPTATTEYAMSAGEYIRASNLKGRRSSSAGVYLDIIGVSCPTEITGLTVEAEILHSRGPVR